MELVRKRNQQLCYEFSFWPEYKDDYDGGIFEFRTYRLKVSVSEILLRSRVLRSDFSQPPPNRQPFSSNRSPSPSQAGCLYEWGNSWAKAINLRKENSVMGICSQIGQMYTVHHIWRYRDLAHRREERNRAWESGKWADCVVRTGMTVLTFYGSVSTDIPHFSAAYQGPGCQHNEGYRLVPSAIGADGVVIGVWLLCIFRFQDDSIIVHNECTEFINPISETKSKENGELISFYGFLSTLEEVLSLKPSTTI